MLSSHKSVDDFSGNYLSRVSPLLLRLSPYVSTCHIFASDFSQPMILDGFIIGTPLKRQVNLGKQGFLGGDGGDGTMGRHENMIVVVMYRTGRTI